MMNRISHMLREHNSLSLFLFFKRTRKRLFLIAIFTVLALFLFSSLPFLNDIKLLDGIATEVIGIFFTFLVIDYYREDEAKKQAELREKAAIEQQQQREAEALAEFKKSLVRQARSRNNNTALDAIDIIREEGWLGSAGSSENLLEGAILSNADLSDADLSGSQLKETVFNGTAILNRVNFNNADLRDAQFNHATLHETTFVGANLVGADFSDATLCGCVFRADRENLHDNRPRLSPRETEKAVCFKGATITGIPTLESNSKEKDRDFTDLSLNSASFEDCKLINIQFKRAVLNGCCFVKAEFTGVTFEDALLENAKFVAIGRDNRPQSKQIANISFRQAQLVEADLRHVSFINVDFTGAQLQNAKCRNASFNNGTKFQRANLQNVEVGDTIFDNVQFDGHTVFVNGLTLQEIYEQERDASNSLDEGKIENAFKSRIAAIAEQYRIKKLLAKISLAKYEKRYFPIEADNGDGDIQRDEITWERVETPLIISVVYPSSPSMPMLPPNSTQIPSDEVLSEEY